MKTEFDRRGVQIEVALRPDGEPDYLYRPGRLLALATAENLSLIGNTLSGLRGIDRELRPDGELAVFTTDALRRNEVSVPQALEEIDRQLGKRNPAFVTGGLPVASPEHVVHVSRICPAVEPEVPSGSPVTPWPAQRPPVKSARKIVIGVSDTGLLEKLDPAQYPWLSDVTGEPDPLTVPSNGGPAQILEYAGHGTFVAGVAKCEAPQAQVLVNNHFSASGGELESEIIRKVLELADRKPDVINLSAGTYTRNDWASLGFSIFNRRHPEIAFVAAAGNDNTDRPFWPAAFDWAVSVGALATDQLHRAWFSNHGRWVDVYALGEGMVNAYATGSYTYNEPPKAPATQLFDGMARWDGTSFSAPLVAGLIAERMARTTDTAAQATAAVLKLASNQVVTGVGPALFPGDAA
ncbi:MAG TPA: S8/S53 family peptidase [Kineosporiaceae bacterium]|nr:S8/S53 family peptidase [Kineosporiaceae bacterium]